MIHQFDGYGSHTMILDKLHKLSNFKNILEFGGGGYSTPFFMEIPGSSVTTIESQDYDWYLRIKEINPNTIWMPDHGEVIEYTKAHTSKKDLVFLDSHQDLRYQLAPIVMEYTDIVVMHDSETASYRCHEIPIDFEKWHYADFVMYRPWTGVLCTSEELLNGVLSQIPGIRYKDIENKIYLYDI
jgi:hypothetical protein